MGSRKRHEKSVIGTRQKGLKVLIKWFADSIKGLLFPPKLLVKLKGEPQALYPRMSRGEIRHVAAAICKTALRNAK
ncbi:MAG: hypothetical protein K0S22_712 [Oscillospiraceae bacterium]|nr:hypothetical protein [Oscillospiraceae bacterium]